MITEGFWHADLAALYEMAGHRDVAPTAATITRVRAAEDQRDSAIGEIAALRTRLVDNVAELRALAEQTVRRTAAYERCVKSRHITTPRRDGKVPPTYVRPDSWQLASSAGVVFAASPATVHELSPAYRLDDVIASSPVSSVHDDTSPHFPCDFRGPNCGPTGRSPAVRYVAVPVDQRLVLFGLCCDCTSTVADLVGPECRRRDRMR